tara:strand:- start:29176 stop:29841 length:666 start_codon:yes stop_codon:yes gene_type:complete
MVDVPLPKYGTSDSGDKNLLQEAQNNGEVTQNTLNKLMTAFAGRANVIDERATPPGSPAELDIYRVATTPTGDWSTFDAGDLAIFIDSAWYELDAFDGLKIYQEDTNAELVFTGVSWQEGVSSVTTAISASVTQTQGQQPLTSRINDVGTVSNANDVVTLPTAIAALEVVVINEGANALQVFPATSDDIDGGATNASTTVAVGAVAHFYATDAVSWFKLEA